MANSLELLTVALSSGPSTEIRPKAFGLQTSVFSLGSQFQSLHSILVCGESLIRAAFGFMAHKSQRVNQLPVSISHKA